MSKNTESSVDNGCLKAFISFIHIYMYSVSCIQKISRYIIIKFISSKNRKKIFKYFHLKRGIERHMKDTQNNEYNY